MWLRPVRALCLPQALTAALRVGVDPRQGDLRGAPVPWSEASALSPLLNHELLEAELIF